jgi:hypothetical protein
MTEHDNHEYRLEVYNGRYKIYIDNLVFLSFNQIDFKGYYAFKDDVNLFGIDVYLTNGVTLETSYKTQKVWKAILELFSKEL